jgi:hypothetical protein
MTYTRAIRFRSPLAPFFERFQLLCDPRKCVLAHKGAECRDGWVSDEEFRGGGVGDVVGRRFVEDV